MKPYYQDELVTIYHGDCLQVMSDDEIADVLIAEAKRRVDDDGSLASASEVDPQRESNRVIPNTTPGTEPPHEGGSLFGVGDSCWLGIDNATREIRESVVLLIVAMARARGLDIEQVPTPVPTWDVVRVRRS